MGLLLHRSPFIIPTACRALRIDAVVVSKRALLDIAQVLAQLLVLLASKVHALGPLPRFNAQKEQKRLDKDDTPLPRDGRMLKDGGVNDGNVDDGEHGDEAGNDGPKEKLVAPDVNDPLGKVALALGLHAEEAAAQVDHLPGEEEGEPGQAGKGRRAGAEHDLAVLRVRLVAVVTNVGVAVAEAKEDDGEGADAERGHPDSVDNHVDQEFRGEDTLLELKKKKKVSIKNEAKADQKKRPRTF